MSKYLVELLGVYNNSGDIDFNKLPNKFVLKCNHGCGYNIICNDKNKLNINRTIKTLDKWMKEDFSLVSAEPHYRKIDRKIICEQFLEDDTLTLMHKKDLEHESSIKASLDQGNSELAYRIMKMDTISMMLSKQECEKIKHWIEFGN